MQIHIFKAFVKAINAHDVDMLYSLMAEDHNFVDAQGNVIASREKMKAGWTAYFSWFPDYKIEITNVFSSDSTIAAFGFASGTFHNKTTSNNKNYWRLPAAWKAEVVNNKIRLWQVYADTKIPFDIIEKNT